jgi:nucleoside-diphosphate-sugar epimerase
MREAVFVTGGSGFVGRHLVPLLARSRRVFALRRPGSPRSSAGAGVISIEADLANTELYAHALAECSMVVHLAAATGKRPATEYFRVNTAGTTRLLQACRAAGVPRFLFMSTIAATFPDRRHYPYAESKARAESAVRESGLDYLIVRPTVVVGPGAPAWTGLAALARGAVVVVPGRGRALMQPIDVADLVTAVGELVERFPRPDTIVELGGPEQVTVEALLRGISRRRGGSAPRVVHLPLGPMIGVLARLEPRLLPVLPVTAGQLSAFRYDTTARPPRAGLASAPAKGVEVMLDEAGLGPARETEAPLTQECRALTMHLVGHEPPPYVVDRYGDAHARLTRLRGGSAFDRILVELAVRHPFLARLADAYTAVFARRALVRQKWVLLLALLETTGSTAGHLDRPDHRSPVRLALSALTVAAGSAASFAFSLVTILPLHAACVAGTLIRPRRSR